MTDLGKFLSMIFLAGTAVVVHAVAAPPEVSPVEPVAPVKWEVVQVKAGLVVYQAAPASTWITHADGVDLYVFEQGARAAFVIAAGQKVRVEIRSPSGESRRVEFVVNGAPAPPAPDALKDKLAAAWGKEVGPDKKAQVKDLAELYRQCATTICPNAAYATGRAVVNKARDTAVFLKIGDALPEVRQGVASELAVVIPDLEATLTKDRRDALAAFFARLAAVLDTLQ